MIVHGDCRDVLPTLDDRSVRCCVTSPPYWNLRDYGVDGQIGLEESIHDYVETMVEVFGEVMATKRIRQVQPGLFTPTGKAMRRDA